MQIDSQEKDGAEMLQSEIRQAVNVHKITTSATSETFQKIIAEIICFCRLELASVNFNREVLIKL